MRVGSSLGTALGLSLLLVLAAPAAGVVIELDTTEPGCTSIVTSVASCEVPAGSHVVTVTWRFDQQVAALAAYDLAIRWSPDELTLLGSTPIFPDGGTPEPFLEEPSDPADSNAVALSLVLQPTTQLFSVSFLVDASGSDGQADLEWESNPPGLSPGSVVLDNPTGASIDFWTSAAPSVPLLPPSAWAPLALGMGALGARSVRPRGARGKRT